MERFLFALLVTVLVLGPSRTVSAEDAQATAILDKAMKALGGEDRLGKIKAATWKSKGKGTLDGQEEWELTAQTTVQGLDHFRSEVDLSLPNTLKEDLKREGITKEQFEEELKKAGLKEEDLVPKIKIVAALNGDKAWFTAMDYPGQPAAPHMRQTVYLEVIPVILAPLKGPGFKMEAAGEDKVGGQAVVVLKVTCPDGKDIKISFDKASSLPVKAVSKVFTLDDREVTQEITYGN
jgi:hypothetical protein